MSPCSEKVEEYLQCDKDTAYDFVHLVFALNLKDTTQDADHGKMTAVIRYETPYIMKDCGAFILSFALVHDVSLRCIPGLHTLLSIRTANNLLSGELLVRNSIETFPLL